MSPDEYSAIVAELEKELEQANEVFEAETEPAYQQLEEARRKYYKEVYDPADLRFQEKLHKIEAKKQEAFNEMCTTHLDLIEEKLKAKIREKL